MLHGRHTLLYPLPDPDPLAHPSLTPFFTLTHTFPRNGSLMCCLEPPSRRPALLSSLPHLSLLSCPFPPSSERLPDVPPWPPLTASCPPQLSSTSVFPSCPPPLRTAPSCAASLPPPAGTSTTSSATQRTTAAMRTRQRISVSTSLGRQGGCKGQVTRVAMRHVVYTILQDRTSKRTLIAAIRAMCRQEGDLH